MEGGLRLRLGAAVILVAVVIGVVASAAPAMGAETTAARAPAASGTREGPVVQSVTADRSGVTVEVAMPSVDELVARAPISLTCAQLPYHRPRAGSTTALYAQPPPGQYGWLVGVPGDLAGGSGATVSSVEVAESSLEPTQFCPGLSRRAPPDVAELQHVGVLRHQPVARLVVRFLAVRPDGYIARRSRVRVRIDFLGDQADRSLDPEAPRASPEPGPFGLVLDTLLNADHLPVPAWDLASATPAGALSGRVVPGAVDGVDERPTATTPRWFGDPDALKLVVASDGPVQVTGAQLAASGWDLAELNPTSITVSRGHATVAVILTGTDDGHMDPTDTILFEGRAATGLYTRENVYWIAKQGRGTRSVTVAASDRRAPRAQKFYETVHLEEDSNYLLSLRSSVAADRWLWGSGLVASSPLFTTSLVIRNLSTAESGGRLRVQLLGFAHDPSTSPDHRVRVNVNGVLVREDAFDGHGLHVVDATLSAGVLRSGSNLVELRSVGSGAALDSVFVDWIEVYYEGSYRAIDNHASVGAPGEGAYAFRIDGFTRPDILTVDVTNPDGPVALGDTSIHAVDGTYGVRFTIPVTMGTRIRAFTPDAAHAPDRIEANTPSEWSTAQQGADYVVITHPAFADAVEALARWHRARGLRVVTVIIEDVYDEFSAGVFDPRAIKAFLQHAFRDWQPPAPTYVLLVGEANLDYRGAYGRGPRNFVPSVQFDTTTGLTGEMGAATSDQWYAAVAGDDILPDLLLGRISVSDAHQARTVVDKTLRFLDDSDPEAWQRSLVLVADDDDPDVFESFSDELAATLPAGGTARRFYAASYPTTNDLGADIGRAIEKGALAVNFTGHGNVSLWGPWPGGGRIFENADISRLRNGSRMPLFTSATCMNGWFDHPFSTVSMAEMWLLNPDGGGVAAWTPSGLAAMSAQRVMLPSLYRGLFDQKTEPIGVLATNAVIEAVAQAPEWSDVIRMFVLFGDPSLVVSGAVAAPLDERTFLPNVRSGGVR